MNRTLIQEMGIRIIIRRRQLGLTQEELAEKAELNSQVISTAELGKKALRPENIARLSKALDVSADYLLTGMIIDKDILLIDQKIRGLSVEQVHHLENIIESYVYACNSGSLCMLTHNR